MGFGLQKIAANYISGFVILAERSLRIGDMVRIDNFDGRITDIRTRYTLIRALNGREAIVPNELLITQRVENSSLADLSVLVTTNVQVAYGTDVRALKPQLEAAVVQVTRVLADPPPAVHLLAFADNGMDLAVNFWITDPETARAMCAPKSTSRCCRCSTIRASRFRTRSAWCTPCPCPQVHRRLESAPRSLQACGSAASSSSVKPAASRAAVLKGGRRRGAWYRSVSAR